MIGDYENGVGVGFGAVAYGCDYDCDGCSAGFSLLVVVAFSYHLNRTSGICSSLQLNEGICARIQPDARRTCTLPRR